MDNSEWFDVVDAIDLPIGRERREVVHSRELFHRAIHVFVLDTAGLGMAVITDNMGCTLTALPMCSS